MRKCHIIGLVTIGVTAIIAASPITARADDDFDERLNAVRQQKEDERRRDIAAHGRLDVLQHNLHILNIRMRVLEQQMNIIIDAIHKREHD